MGDTRAGTPRTLSLRAYLLLLVVGTLVPTVVLAAFLASRVVVDNRETVERRLLEAARSQATLVDAELAGTIRALQGLSESDRLTVDDLAGFYQQAVALLATQPAWTGVSVATPAGRQIANTERPLGSTLPFGTDAASVERAARTQMPAIGNLRIGGVSGQWGFAVRVPVIRDGTVRYIVSAWITSRSFASAVRRQGLSDDWTYAVLDAAGTIVVRSRDGDRFVGQQGSTAFFRRASLGDEGVMRGTSLDGVPVYSALIHAPMSHWYAGVAAPASVIDAPFRQSLLALSALSLLLLGVGGAGAFAVARRLSHDISRSAEEAEAIAQGSGSSHPTSRVSEIQRLLDALERGASLLETRQRERDEQVARADAARDEAQAADRAKDQFLAMLGHELRNPLAPALTALQLMKLKGAAASTREREVVERQIRHMARLVDDLLDVSRLRRGAIELRREPVDVADAIARAVEMTAPLVADKHHVLDVDVAPGMVVDADRVRLAQVVSNLLANAAKYTEPGGRVALRAFAQDREVVIECRDTGIGMPADLVPRVFDLFVQGERGLDRREGGLGLGLAVARTLVELHGGRIEAASDGPHRGSTFTVRLPLRAGTAAASPAPAAPVTGADIPGGGARIGRVLVVDDNADALEMLVEALRTAGIEVYSAATPRTALEVAARVAPQAAILDIGLPEMNGYELARAMRAQAPGTRLRLVALTGYGQPQDMTAAREAGFDAFLVKPVDTHVLVAALTHEVVAP
ncbi:MAG TPA: ATP-binding protein [Vicinamibacterales bacterium]|nr:ATP-binding protein [Vicinamibacterales bacterium]